MDQATAQNSELKKVDPRPAEATSTAPSQETQTTEDPKKTSCKKHHTKKSPGKSPKPKKKSKKEESSESESSTSSSVSEEESSESESDSTDDVSAAKKKKKGKQTKAAKKKLLAKQSKNKKKLKQPLEEEDLEDDEDDDEGENDAAQLQQLKRANAKAQAKALRGLQMADDMDGGLFQQDASLNKLRALQQQLQQQHFQGLDPSGQSIKPGRSRLGIDPTFGGLDRLNLGGLNRLDQLGKPPKKVVSVKKKKKRASKVAYKRVDQLWDQSIHQYKLTETVPEYGANEWDQYIFTVRRKFDWEHKYQETLVDIKSKPLKECLQQVMTGVKGVSLVQDTPHIDPNLLFLYLEECRSYMQKMEAEAESAKKKKDRKAATNKSQHLRILIRYLDKDYAETKKTLYPMLEHNMISFDLLWALFKPNSIAYTTTYGDTDHPRAFKIDYATKESHFMKGNWYDIEGKYLEYDGKSFGMGTLAVQVPSFQGVRRIPSLECYPLHYHKDSEKLKTELIERGKKFVALEGVHYKFHKGMAFTKRKRQILKININGRIMCDPAIHRRINPNYQVSNVKAKEADDEDVFEVNDSEDDSDCGCGDDSSEAGDEPQNTPSSSEEASRERRRFRVVKTPDGRTTIVEVDPNEEVESMAQKDRITDTKQGGGHAFTEEELLIASPVVLGFAFNEKLWLEFTVAGIQDVIFNEDAFDSLVLPENQKSIVKALVSSHAFHPSKSIDDIISGKGRGLCCVLHGPPGTGKTLTAEGIADLLKCPLYMVSAGDLGTDPRNLEKELQSILDIAHSWGAILLLDEADVFLEKRSIHDIHRNALVSIFLRLLEYFQGILFLTTNRVETFDEAFVSRIHLSLRYEELSTKARHRVWKLFLEKVKSTEGVEIAKISESDYTDLARRDVNGRQIKNLVRAAQALAVHEKKPLSMVHIKRVIDVAESFVRDLKGGTGYSDAMRSYT